MKFHQDSSAEQHLFTGYGDGYVMVDKVRYDYPLIVQPDQIARWPVTGFDLLTVQDFDALNVYTPELVIFGAGPVMRFPHPALISPLTAKGIGVECMDTAAACRTFNILCTEGRRVLAALLL